MEEKVTHHLIQILSKLNSVMLCEGLKRMSNYWHILFQNEHISIFLEVCGRFWIAENYLFRHNLLKLPPGHCLAWSVKCLY